MPDLDGAEKTLTEVYEDRNLLAVALAAAVESGGWHVPTNDDDADADEWAVCWAVLPTGQASWHVPRHLVERTDLKRQKMAYDGHSRTEKNARLLRFANDPTR